MKSIEDDVVKIDANVDRPHDPVDTKQQDSETSLHVNNHKVNDEDDPNIEDNHHKETQDFWPLNDQDKIKSSSKNEASVSEDDINIQD